jgi:hypothetical protein
MLKKVVRTARSLGHVELIDLVDGFCGRPVMRMLMVLPQSAHSSSCCLGHKDANAAAASAQATDANSLFASELRKINNISLP